MRNTVIVACAVWLLVSAAAAQSEGKVDSQWKCDAPSTAHKLDPGDGQGHVYVLSEGSCTATKGTILGTAEKTGKSTQFDDVTPDESSWKGVFIDTLSSGDTIFIHYNGSGKTSGDKLVSGSNNWTVVGGTGTFEHATGKGSCKGKGNDDGSTVWDCKGNVSLPKKKQK